MKIGDCWLSCCREDGDDSGEFNSQVVTSTLWVYVTIGRKPGNRLINGSTGGEDGVDIRGVQIAVCCKHVMGVCDKGEESGRRWIG